jgi:cytochrome c biogenesis protein CcdA
VIDAPLAFAFSAGLVAAFNPCGFAMLPAYLSFFLGVDDADDAAVGVTRALRVGLLVTGGFVVVFGVVGVLVSHLSVTIEEYLPWVTIIIGIGLVVLAIAMLRGFELTVALPKLNKGGDTRTDRSMFVFGVSYAIASLSCTLPIFLIVTATTFRNSNFASGVAAFGAYALGMGLVLMVLTVAIALTRQTLVSRLRSAVRWVNPVSAVLLLIAGAYVAYYGWYELRVRDDPETFAGPAQWVTDLQTDIQAWIQDVGAVRLGLVLALLVTLAALYAVLRASRAEPDGEPETAAPEDGVVETTG